MTALKKPHFSAQDYLVWEVEQTEKHEYLAGEVFAMAGASDAHVTISGNIFMALRNHLRGKPCRVYIADMKVEVARADAFFYPDVFVSCSTTDAALADRKREPLLLVEVLSPTTASYDRGAKFASYRQLESLHEYVLIDTERLAVDVFRRDTSGHWVLYPYGPGEAVELASVDLTLSLAQVYEDASPVTATA
ncbi:MAG: Uma2 family endonuclease [Rhodocyclaceae bacterium]|nr:Uma2 family endonuclease [Rhodocyclaceae bacterium]MDZ4216681.1 Uma2 family endonuclease [Rhodocyclaceae bacterium]